jgi:hypothetical protein
VNRFHSHADRFHSHADRPLQEERFSSDGDSGDGPPAAKRARAADEVLAPPAPEEGSSR